MSSNVNLKINYHNSLFITLALSGKGAPSLLQSSCGVGEPETEHRS